MNIDTLKPAIVQPPQRMLAALKAMGIGTPG
jgi:hypothetical protein